MISMTSGDLDGCSSLLEYACICRSAAYQSSVAVCSFFSSLLSPERGLIDDDVMRTDR